MSFPKQSVMKFEDYKKERIRDLKESIRLFSNKGKKELEVWVVKEFLNILRIPWTEKEIIQTKPKEEPPDVILCDARFEVMELYDYGRHRHKEFMDALKKIEAAANYSEVLERTSWDRERVTLQQILSLAEDRLHEKKGHYAANTKKTLDVLIYVNLLNMTIDDLDCGFVLLENSELRQWRSVSLVFNRDMICVAYASVASPESIKSTAGNIFKKGII